MVHPSALSEYFRYTEWATRRLLDFALTVPEEHVTRLIENSHGGILKTFQHIYYADRVWLTPGSCLLISRIVAVASLRRK